MAVQTAEFVYRDIELYKSQSLGSGSYGGVCKANCDGLLCAAKIMHPTLFDLHDPGAPSFLRKFREECRLLSLARHPNVVQYLGTHTDPDTRLPVLLMELCDESLTAFLERSPGPLSYHIQVNICHDIALALVYLHSNGLIHRDLTGNNVLMIAGPRAKITDFGMSKLISINPRMTAMTLCPGNLLYMSPEALDEAKSYTAKLDVFSFGIIVIQILTRQFPNPTNRFCMVPSSANRGEDVEDDNEVWQLVPETERRKNHLDLIPDTHSLKPIAVQCLKKRETHRPSALQLSEHIFELKKSPHYTESVCLIQQLEQQLRDEKIISDAKTKEVEALHTQVTELERVVHERDTQILEKDQQLLEKEGQVVAKQQEVSARDKTIEGKERELQKTLDLLQHTCALLQSKLFGNALDDGTMTLQQKLKGSEQLVSEILHSLQDKEKTITDLQQTISDHETKIQQLQQQGTPARRDQPQQLEQQDTAAQTQQQQPVSTPQTTVAAAQKKDISEMKWREGGNAPEAMYRGAAVAHGETAYFSPAESNKVYAYQHNGQNREGWSQLPDNPNANVSLVVIEGLLTSVGGRNVFGPANTLFTLKGNGEISEWLETFPPMLTPRDSVASVSTELVLVVAGGDDGASSTKTVDTVEVMDIETKLWATACPLPQKRRSLTATLCGGMLYLGGGYTDRFAIKASKSVFTCSLLAILPPTPLRPLVQQNQEEWKEICTLPMIRSALVSFGGDLLAVGGTDDVYNPITNIYRYDLLTDSWDIVSCITNKYTNRLVVALGDECIVVVGGVTPRYFRSDKATDNVEILL